MVPMWTVSGVPVLEFSLSRIVYLQYFWRRKMELSDSMPLLRASDFGHLGNGAEKQCNLWQSLTMLDRFFSLNSCYPWGDVLYPWCYAKAVWIFGFHWVGFCLWEDIAKGRHTVAGFTWEATLSLQSWIPVYYLNHILGCRHVYYCIEVLSTYDKIHRS